MMDRTKYRKGVKAPHINMLKPGRNNKKLGGTVSVKMWQDKPLFSLTLEERKTCPTTCQQWDNCYGNNMPFAHRFDHTHQDFRRSLEYQLRYLMEKHPDGIVVRLHVLGDFYSVEYVQFWEKMLDVYPTLSIYGYTHRETFGDIGSEIVRLNVEYPSQFRVRFSDDDTTPFAANTYATKADVPADEIICPEQLGATPSCADCGLCWAMKDKPVAFLEH
jgi:hypothetical protein